MPGRLSIQQVRVLVLLLLIVTALVTAGAYLLGLQRRMASESPPPPRVPPNVSRSEGFSLSKSERGHTLFTVKAARAREQTDTGRSLLEDVEITTYGAQGDRHDRIFSKACEYDAKTGQVRSQGEVEMELATPRAGAGELLQNEAAGKGGAPALPGEASRSGPIYLKTSGVTFDEKTGVVVTDRPVEFRFARGSGRATGAAYDSNQRMLKLKADVQIKAAGTPLDGSTPSDAQPAPASAGEPVEIRAAELVYAQRESQIRLERPALRRALPGGGTRQLTGDRGVLLLDAQNNVRSSEITGNVRVEESVPAAPGRESRETRLATNQMEVVLKDRVVDQVYATGAVRLDSWSPRSRTEATAGRLELFFAGKDGALSQIEWKGGVRMVLTPRGGAAGADTRVLTSEAVEMFMAPDGSNLSGARTLAPGRLELLPSAWSASTEGPGPAGMPVPTSAASAGARPARFAGRRVLTAGLIFMEFGEQSQVRLLHAEKNVRLESEVRAAPNPASPGASAAPPPPLRIMTSDVLDARFAPDTQQLQTLEQRGNFHYAEGERQANADAAHYNAESETVTLTGRPGRNPEVWDTETRTSARQIVLNDKTGEGTAEHEVRSVHLPRDPSAPGASPVGAGFTPARERPGIKPGPPPASPAKQTAAPVPGPLSDKEPVHVVAERMLSNSRTGVTRYEAGAGGPRVRLWQNNDVIEARVIVLERDQKRLTGEGQVTTVLVENTKAPAGPAAPPARSGQTEGAAQPLVVTAERLVYTDNERCAHYERRVVLRRASSTMTAASLDAYLLAPDEVKPGESRLSRAVARGNVQIVETRPDGERRAAAELAEYERAEEKMVLSGGEPYIYDAQRGYTRGRQLTYYVRDDRIFVHGDNASRTVTEQRVTRRR